MAKVKITGHASGSGVITVTAPNTSTDRTITLPDATATIATTAATDALTTRVNATGGRKNFIINGGMQVAQRSTSASSVASTGIHALDRIKFGLTTLGEYTVSQSSDAPDGFGSSMKIDCTTADASPAAGDRLHFFTLLEGQDVQSIKKGSASAESVTLSFWVKCTKTGAIQVNLQDNDNSRLIGSTATVNTANTWEYKTITYAGDASGVFGNDTGDSLQIDWWLDSGSTYNSGAVPTSWEAYSAGDRAAGETLAFGDSTANDFYITGVQLELGSVATDFEHRSYGEELALCHRYCYKTATGVGNSLYGIGNAWTATSGNIVLQFLVSMRASPSFTASGSFSILHNQSAINVSVTGQKQTTDFIRADVSGSGFTVNGAFSLRNANDANAYLLLDAEL